MTGSEAESATSAALALDAAAVGELRSGLRGELLAPGDPGYGRARTIWNAMIDRFPALIARCRTTADVQACVRFAGRHGLLTAVRGGGHSIAGKSVCDSGLMIDLSLMNSVRIDPAARRAVVQGGCLLGDLDRAAQLHGLATPAGIVSTTGVAGLTLGGGFGWLSRRYGLTIDNLLSARVVTAEGELLTASASENPDLFWGLRGGGGNFGIVTSFEFALHPVGPQVLAGAVIRPFARAEQYLRLHREYAAAIPEELTVWLRFRYARPSSYMPDRLQGQLVLVVLYCWCGVPEAGARVVEPLRAGGEILAERSGPVEFGAWQKAFDALQEPGARNYLKSHYLKDLDDGACAAILSFAERLPSADSEIFIPRMAGAIDRVDGAATAYAHRGAPYLLNIHARWRDSELDAAARAWARGFFEATRPSSTGGVYVNFLSDEGEARVHDAYPAATWDRLRRIKQAYDPANLFRLNQNIPPEGPLLTSRV